MEDEDLIQWILGGSAPQNGQQLGDALEALPGFLDTLAKWLVSTGGMMTEAGLKGNGSLADTVAEMGSSASALAGTAAEVSAEFARNYDFWLNS